MAKHIRRALDCVESVLNHDSGLPVGQIVEATLDDANHWILAEIMHIQIRSDGKLFYYLHFLGQPKKDDDWLPEQAVRLARDLDPTKMRPLAKVETPSSSSEPTTGDLWPGFFQLSQLTRELTAGTSAYGASSGPNHDPHEFSPKTVVGIDFGTRRIKAWYRSPYPRNVWSMDEYLHVCERCLSYGAHSLADHNCSEPLPGAVVYSKDNLIVREIDGLDATQFSERLFLLTKLFLEDKRTSADETSQLSQVTPFLFYALFEVSEKGRERFVGYFSKYKLQKRDSPILSCIMVLPSEQRKGFGKLLISIAYELAKREGRQGSAERPLSGPGLAAFMSWWTWRLRTVVEKCFDGEVLTISQLSDLSGMTSDDVVETLRFCGALKQWGTSSSAADVKLRESGKRTKIRLTMDIMRALESKCPRSRISLNEFDSSCLTDDARLCPVVYTPAKP